MGKDILHRVGNGGHCGCETVSREVLPQVEIPEKWTQEPPCFAITIWCAIKIAHQWRGSIHLQFMIPNDGNIQSCSVSSISNYCSVFQADIRTTKFCKIRWALMNWHATINWKWSFSLTLMITNGGNIVLFWLSPARVSLLLPVSNFKWAHKQQADSSFHYR